MCDRSCARDENYSGTITKGIAECDVAISLNDYFVSKLEILDRRCEGALFVDPPNSRYPATNSLTLSSSIDASLNACRTRSPITPAQ